MLDGDKNNLVRALRVQLNDEKILLSQIRMTSAFYRHAVAHQHEGDVIVLCYRYKIWVVLTPRKG